MVAVVVVDLKERLYLADILLSLVGATHLNLVTPVSIGRIVAESVKVILTRRIG